MGGVLASQIRVYTDQKMVKSNISSRSGNSQEKLTFLRKGMVN